MYCSVPSTARGVVTSLPIGVRLPEDFGVGPGATFASAKSRSFAPLAVSITFDGSRSRCTTPWRCALSSASVIAIAIVSASSIPIGPRDILAASVSPSRYSMTRKSMPACPEPAAWAS
jgi:hypothetical protein